MAEQLHLFDPPAPDTSPVPPAIASLEATVIETGSATTIEIGRPQAATAAQTGEAAPPAPAPEAPAETPVTPAEPQVPQDTEAKLNASGLDMAALGEEFSKDGKFSEETYAKLAEKGIDKAAVDGYIEGQKAKVTAYNQSLALHVGGEQQLSDLLQWADTNLEAGEKEAANGILQSMQGPQAKLLLDGLKSRYTNAVGHEPSLVTGPTTAARAPQKFQSNAEMVAAMRDPRYATDEAYRQQVQQRL